MRKNSYITVTTWGGGKMWIIPSNHQLYSVFAPGCVGSKEELNELSDVLPSQLMWKSKPSLFSIWSGRWNKVWWMRHLYGRILKPSHQGNFTERYTVSLADIHVNHLARLGSKKGKTTLAICGHTSAKRSHQLALFGAFLKMSPTTSTSDSSKSILSYRQWVIQLRQECIQRKKLVLHISENVSSSLPWRTPMSTDHGAKTTSQNFAENLSEQVRNWGTPRVTSNGMTGTNAANPKGRLEDQILMWSKPTTSRGDYQNVNRDKNGVSRGIALKLTGQVKQWHTPLVQDSRSSGTMSSRLHRESLELATQVQLNSQPDRETTSTSGKSREQLNPAWVAQLMGTTLKKTFFGCMEMELLNNPQN